MLYIIYRVHATHTNPMQTHWKPFALRRLSIKQFFRPIIEWRRTLTSVTSAFNWRTLLTVFPYTHVQHRQNYRNIHTYTRTYTNIDTHWSTRTQMQVYINNIYIYTTDTGVSKRLYRECSTHQSRPRRTWINCHCRCRRRSHTRDFRQSP